MKINIEQSKYLLPSPCFVVNSKLYKQICNGKLQGY